MSLIEKRPKLYTEIDIGMSNFDHTIDSGVEKKLKEGKYYAQYSGWDFCGYVWWNKNKWSCEVWVYNSHVDTIHGDALEEIMEKVSEQYGER